MRWSTLALVAGLWAAPVLANASPLDGEWRIEYPCSPSEPACEGRSDAVIIYLWSRGTRLCGGHMISAHWGNRVDGSDEMGGPSIFGTVTGTRATVAFRSAWGGSGHARLVLKDGQLHWHTTDTGEGTSWFPDDVTLIRSETPMRSAVACGAPPTTR